MAKDDNPFSDMMKSFQQFGTMGWPGGQMPDFSKAGTDNFRTMQEIGRISAEALQKMMSRQQEMATEAMSAWQKAARESTTSDPTKMMTRVADLTRENAERTAKNFSELSELAADAQKKIMGAVSDIGKK
ncbi:MAG: phasin family protein [Flavobacteriaceae bacterium]